MKYSLVVVICTILITPLSAQVNTETAFALSDSRSSELRYHMLYESVAADTTDPVSQGNVKIGQLKKPGVGILLSAALPGAGQIYAGSWKRGLLYMGIETAMWVGYCV